MPSPTHLAAVQQNARLLRQRGDLTGARAMLEHALDVAGTAYGAAHPDVLETSRLLAALHREAGELAAARRTLEEALAAGQLTWSEDDPLMLLLAFDLGEVADEFGNRHEARRNMGIVARRGPSALGPDHPAVRAAERYLAQVSEAVPEGSPVKVPRPPLDVQPVPKPPPPGHRPAHERPRRSRTPWVLALVVAALAVGATLTVARLRNQADPPTSPTSPTVAAPSPTRQQAPTGVRLRDEGTSITLTWQDPSRGTVPFIVAGARAGEQSRPFAELPNGRTDYTVSGLNPRLQYCFTIVAVYSTDDLRPSDLVCTRRSSNPQPTRS